MNILLAFKAEPDLSMLPEQAWQEATSGPLDLSYARYQIGLDAQVAAELALRQFTHSQAVNLAALTLGGAHSEPFLRQLNASGFSHLARLEPQSAGDLRFSPEQVADVLAQWVKQHPQALVLTGSQSSEGNNAQTGFLLAERLGWPVLAGVVDFVVDAANHQLEVELLQDGERLRCCVALPVVLIVMNDGRYSLRIPGIRQKLAASKAPIVTAPAAKHAANSSPNVVLTREHYSRRAQKIDGATPQEKARLLYENFLRERLPR